MNAAPPIPTSDRTDGDGGADGQDANACVFIATDVVGDLELVSGILRKEFANVIGSADPARLVDAFDSQPIQVLVLAFDALDKAQDYRQSLSQRSQSLQLPVYRSIVLCTMDELPRAYRLCREDVFDDYVLFWPMSHDAPRLPMAVHLALRHIRASGADGMPTAGDFAAEARLLAPGTMALEQSAKRGAELVDKASGALEKAKVDIGLALDDFEQDLARGPLQGKNAQERLELQAAFERFRRVQVMTRLDQVGSAVRPLWQWLSEANAESARHNQRSRKLGALAKQVKPWVLAVDDDPLQIEILHKLLHETGLELACARSGSEALESVNRRKPDLVLLDVQLPDIDGVEVARRIKTSERFAGVTVIMITGRLDRDLVERCLKSGASGFVVKPFSKETLLAKLRSHLGPGAIV